jgi:mono/diheme cytochrome c family protein
MRKLLRVLEVLVLALLVIVGCAAAFFFWRFPNVGPAPDVRVERTADRVERGRYLANHVTVCIDCHSEQDWKQFSGPLVPGSEGKGGQRFGEEMGLPGTLYASNITPAAIGGWSDGEIRRAVTTGVSRAGTALFPLMPYLGYNDLSEDDANAIVAYLRTLKPIEHAVRDRRLNFPANLIVRTIPAAYTPHRAPERSDHVAYGRYLANIAGCGDCHTPMDKGQPIPNMEFAGGREFPILSLGTARSTNISPDQETGIGAWSKDTFIARFRLYRPGQDLSLPAGSANTMMPWTMFAGMTDEDLSDIYEFLRTVTPVRHQVTRWTPAR